mmetsp:Transcript_4226/g.12332  ORF Transcript_4226/g.12332 Transcript_4226/m.12332 type:complete len:252 (+) Transcript_4226:607-1362(+)
MLRPPAAGRLLLRGADGVGQVLGGLDGCRRILPSKLRALLLPVDGRPHDRREQRDQGGQRRDPVPAVVVHGLLQQVVEPRRLEVHEGRAGRRPRDRGRRVLRSGAVQGLPGEREQDGRLLLRPVVGQLHVLPLQRRQRLAQNHGRQGRADHEDLREGPVRVHLDRGPPHDLDRRVQARVRVEGPPRPQGHEEGRGDVLGSPAEERLGEGARELGGGPAQRRFHPADPLVLFPQELRRLSLRRSLRRSLRSP